MHPRWYNLVCQNKVVRLVENRTVFGGQDTEFCVYDTYAKAESVLLTADNPLICGMVLGKKVIHSNEQAPFAFVPGESLVLPGGSDILIDFPEASTSDPTKCLTIEISCDKLRDITAKLNDLAPRSPDSGEWECSELSHFHFANTPRINRLLEDLVDVFTEHTPYRDLLIDGKIQELVIRIFQTKAIEQLLLQPERFQGEHSLARVAEFVQRNICQSISVDDLCQEAHMSKTKLFRFFKREFGITPVQYINQQRVREACRRLQQPEKSVTDVSYEMGFSSMSYFITLFKQIQGITPKQFQSHLRRQQLANLSHPESGPLQSYSSVG